MADELQGMKIAILAADGVEQVELEQPRDAVQGAGAETELLSLETGEIQAMNQDINKGDAFTVDKAVSDASVDDYDGLLLPGGVINPDNLRVDADAIRFVQEYFKAETYLSCSASARWISRFWSLALRSRRLSTWSLPRPSAISTFTREPLK